MEMDKLKSEILLCHAIAVNDVPSINILLDKDIDVNYSHGLAFLNTCITGNLIVAKKLIEKGLKIERFGWYPPIYYASTNGHYEFVRFLQENYPIPAKYFGTTIEDTIPTGNLRIIEYIVKNNEFDDKKFKFIIYKACKAGQLAILKFLFSKINDISTLGSLPLVYALEYNHIDIVEYLWQKGIREKYRHKSLIEKIFKNNSYESLVFMKDHEFDFTKYRNHVIRNVRNLVKDERIIDFIEKNYPDIKLNPKSKSSNKKIKHSYTDRMIKIKKNIEMLHELSLNKEVEKFKDLLANYCKIEDNIIQDPFYIREMVKTYPDIMLDFLEKEPKIVTENIEQLFNTMMKEANSKVLPLAKFLIRSLKGKPELLEECMTTSLLNTRLELLEYFYVCGARLESPSGFIKLMKNKMEHVLGVAIKEVKMIDDIFIEVDKELIQAVKKEDISVLSNKMKEEEMNCDMLDFIFILAAAQGNLKVSKFLFENMPSDYNVDERILEVALQNNQPKIAKYFLELEYFHEDYCYVDEHFLINAVMMSNIEITRIAIEHGADVNASFNDGMPDIIFSALLCENIEILNLILDKSNPLPIEDILWYVVDIKKPKLLPIILEKYKGVPNDKGSALNYAMKKSQLECGLYLIDYGANWKHLENKEHLEIIKDYFKNLPENHYRYPIAKYILNS